MKKLNCRAKKQHPNIKIKKYYFIFSNEYLIERDAKG